MIDPRIPDHHVAVLGKSGSGKSYASKAVIVEPLLDAGKLVAIVDPTSAWWGLRTSADGKGPGFKVLVLGGDHGDLPLPANGGAAVARLIVEQRVPCVLDTGNLTVGERTRWMIDFAGTLYRLNRSPLYLVVDEAHVFSPQGKVPDPDTGKMLHAVNQIASGGRSRGIRLTMITQRPQKLHKDALTTADTLIAMRVLAPQDRAAVKEWIDGCGDPSQGKKVLDSLAQLQKGEGWVWYPEGSILYRLQFPRIKTFDSSATPTDGQELQQPKGAAEIDLTEIKAALADAVKEAEANDPRVLRKRIAELEAASRKCAADAPQVRANFDEKDLAHEYQRGFTEGHNTMLSNVEGMRKRFCYQLEAMARELTGLSLMAVAAPDMQKGAEYISTAMGNPITDTHQPVTRPKLSELRGMAIPKGELAVLTAIAQHTGGVSREQLTVLTGYKRSTRDAYLQRLRERGFWDQNGEGRIYATERGRDSLGADFEPLPIGEKLRQHWLGRLPDGERVILEHLIHAYPADVERDRLSRETDYKRSTRDAYIQRLRARQLVTLTAGGVRASEELF